MNLRSKMRDYLLTMSLAMVVVMPASAALVTYQPGPEGKDMNIADGQLANINFRPPTPG